jgi:hypothetical protein
VTSDWEDRHVLLSWIPACAPLVLRPGPGYEYGPPPDLPYPRRGRRSRARDLGDYLEDLEDELARVRRELQELREQGTEAGSA